MNIDMSSVIKAGGIAALVALIVGLLSAIPIVNCIVWPLICLGWFLIPIGAGLGYGYLAPGKETMGESALGGALAGGFGGLAFGIVSGLVGLVTNAGMAAVMEDPDLVPGAIAGGVAGLLISVCVPLVGGLFFGAVGGVIWPLVQGQRM